MIGADKQIIIDTNILIYANYQDVHLQQKCRELLSYYVTNGFELWISRQIMREFMVYATRYNKENDNLPISGLIERILLNFNQFQITEDNETITQYLIQLIKKYDLSGKKYTVQILLPPCKHTKFRIFLPIMFKIFNVLPI